MNGTEGRSDGKEGEPMKTLVAIVAVAAVLLLSIITAIAGERGFDGQVTDENPYLVVSQDQQ